MKNLIFLMFFIAVSAHAVQDTTVLPTIVVTADPVDALDLKFDEKVPNSVRNQITKDLDFTFAIENTFQSPLHKIIYGGAYHMDTYRDFYTSRVHEVGFDPNRNANWQAMLDINKPHRILITSKYVSDNVPQMSRVLIQFHEARHAEEDDHWYHAKCPMSFSGNTGVMVEGNGIAGEYACDTTVYGAYATSGIMLKNIAMYCMNCTSKVKMDADFYADDAAKRIIDPQAQKALMVDYAR